MYPGHLLYLRVVWAVCQTTRGLSCISRRLGVNPLFPAIALAVSSDARRMMAAAQPNNEKRAYFHRGALTRAVRDACGIPAAVPNDPGSSNANHSIVPGTSVIHGITVVPGTIVMSPITVVPGTFVMPAFVWAVCQATRGRFRDRSGNGWGCGGLG